MCRKQNIPLWIVQIPSEPTCVFLLRETNVFHCYSNSVLIHKRPKLGAHAFQRQVSLVDFNTLNGPVVLISECVELLCVLSNWHLSKLSSSFSSSSSNRPRVKMLHPHCKYWIKLPSAGACPHIFDNGGPSGTLTCGGRA